MNYHGFPDAESYQRAKDEQGRAAEERTKERAKHDEQFARTGRRVLARTISGLTRNGGRSKYMPHIGAKERGRYA
jgi:hypothetical protein